MKLNRLKTLRKEKGLMQEEVAEYLKISPPAYSHYETGFTEPDVANLIKLSELYKVSIDYIVGATNERERTSSSKKAPEKSLSQEIISSITKNVSALGAKKISIQIDL